MPTTIRLDPDIEKRLTFLANKTGRTKAFYIREMIQNSLQNMEDYYLASHVSEQIRQGKHEVLTTKEVEQELGLAD
ncbi:hypothetical protein COMNV_00891 [Commensalibacter sp. Nvir]|uniref:type II toxin-antitoxin system RelB family antitoxin n=1 Tax=Commensalibacter sp. Nvir TaxID=3069817 RepID=UPI002D439C82|nr:hypothetical protein COMNV_00891 [Commensalibacter sp. Nvir]